MCEIPLIIYWLIEKVGFYDFSVFDYSIDRIVWKNKGYGEWCIEILLGSDLSEIVYFLELFSYGILRLSFTFFSLHFRLWIYFYFTLYYLCCLRNNYLYFLLYLFLYDFWLFLLLRDIIINRALLYYLNK